MESNGIKYGVFRIRGRIFNPDSVHLQIYSHEPIHLLSMYCIQCKHVVDEWFVNMFQDIRKKLLQGCLHDDLSVNFLITRIVSGQHVAEDDACQESSFVKLPSLLQPLLFHFYLHGYIGGLLEHRFSF